MTTLTVIPLNNGIILDVGEVVKGVLPLVVSPTVCSYLYYTNQGKLYWQANTTTAVELLGNVGFAINCADSYSDGLGSWYFWIGGALGDYSFVTVTPDYTDPNVPVQTNTIVSANANPTKNYTAVAFDNVSPDNMNNFTVGDSDGGLYSASYVDGALTFLQTLTVTSQPPATTLVINKICYDYYSNSYLICVNASSNDNTANAGNYTAVFAGTLGALTLYEFIGKNLWLGAIGWLENSSALPNQPLLINKVKYVVAGEAATFYESDDGITWTQTLLVGQGTTILSLCFNKWAFVAGLPWGDLLISTDGIRWTLVNDNTVLGNNVTSVVAVV